MKLQTTNFGSSLETSWSIYVVKNFQHAVCLFPREIFCLSSKKSAKYGPMLVKTEMAGNVATCNRPASEYDLRAYLWVCYQYMAPQTRMSIKTKFQDFPFFIFDKAQKAC